MVSLTDRINLHKPFDARSLYTGNGNTLVLANITNWGHNLHLTTNGGGEIHWAENLPPLDSIADLASGKPGVFRMDDLASGDPRAIVVNEIAASYAVLGYFLASGKTAVCDFTTGGAAD